MRREISNNDDVIDSRDIIERLEELQDERQSLIDAVEEAHDARNDYEGDDSESIAALDSEITYHNDALQDWDGENGEELKALTALEADASSADDWTYGATLIRDDYFTEYVKEMLEDCGDLPRDLPSYIEIDWAATADNIRQDYFSVDFDGVTYWVR